VKNGKLESLSGATILAIHTPTGPKYSSISNEDGRFNILNMRIGGPYEITVTYLGNQNQKINDVYLESGKASSFEFILEDESQKLDEV
jgi:hypothetical protein